MNTFLFLLIALITILLQTTKIKKEIKIYLFFLFSFIGFLYLYLNFNPSVKTFNNADKHVIASEAIEFKKNVILYNNKDYNNLDSVSIYNDNSILGSDYGGFEIYNEKKPKFILKNFQKPFYLNQNGKLLLQNKIGNSIVQKIKLIFLDDVQIELIFNDKFPFSSVVLIKDSNSVKYNLDKINYENLGNKTIKFGYPFNSYIIDNITVKKLNTEQTKFYQILKDHLDKLNKLNLVREEKDNKNSKLNLVGRFNKEEVIDIQIDDYSTENLSNVYTINGPNPNCIFSLSYNKSKPEDYVISESDNDFLRLENKNIHWFPLFSNKSTDEARIFFTSNPKSVVKTVFNKGIYFYGNKNPKSLSSFDASLSYNQATSRSILNLEILDHNYRNNNLRGNNQIKVNEGDEFKLNTKLNSQNQSNKIYRCFKLLNVEKNSVFKPIILYGFYLIIVLIFSILLIYKNPKKTDVYKIYANYLSPLATLILTFIIIKFFLLWRTSVFLPFSDLDQNLYHNLNNSTYLYRNTLLPLAFFFSIAFYRKLNLNQTIFIKVKLEQIFWIYAFIGFLLVLRAFGLHKLLPIIDRFTAIYFPILAYFYSYYIIFSHVTDSKLKNYVNYFNILLFSFYFLLSDAGFAIIFILFALLKEIIVNLNTVKLNHGTTKYKILNKKLAIHLILLSIAILGSTYFVSFAFNNFKLVILFFVVIIFSFLIYFILCRTVGLQNFLRIFQSTIPYFKSKTEISISKNTKIFSICILSLILLGSIIKVNSIEKKFLHDFIHIKYRAQTLTSEVKNIIQNEEFGTYNSRKIVETATNKWFLSYFLHKGNNVSYFDLNKPYELQKHFKHGVTYQTQSTDVMASRYIIGEHGWLTPIVLSILFLTVLIYLLLNTPKCYLEDSKQNKSLIAILGLLFLMTIAFFVNLTVTNKFIFFGQDFPFLSLQSLVSSVMFFSVMAAVFYWFDPNNNALPSTQNATPTITNSRITIGSAAPSSIKNSTINPHPNKKFNKLLWLFIPLVFVIIPYAIHKNNYLDTFKLNNVFSEIENDFENLNNTLKSIQSVEGYDDRKIKNLSELFDKISFKSNSKYANTLFEKLKTELSSTDSKNLYKINESGILGPIILKKNNNNILQVKLQNNFYDLPSPDAFEKMWKGSLVAKNINNSSTITDISNLDSIVSISHTITKKFNLNGKNAHNVNFHVLPSSWFYNENSDIIVTDLNSGTHEGTRGNFKILRANENVRVSKLSTIATRLINEDIISIEEGNFKQQYFYASENIKYFAKNIWMNGDFKHFYPFENQFVLAYNTVENLKSDPTLERSKENIELNLDYELYSNLQSILNRNLVQCKNDIRNYEFYENVLKDMNANVVVITGHGEVVAINDSKFKNPNLDFNPNETESIYKTRLKLISNYSSFEEEKVFGNNNLLKLKTGPQSTIKPILYASVASGYNLGWNNIVYKAPLNNSIFETSKKEVYKYLNTPINLSSANPKEDCDNITYLKESRNTFNMLVTIMGSYDRKDFDNMRQNILSEFDTNNEQFPSFLYNGNRYVFNFSKFKTGNTYNFSNEESLLRNQLYVNFNLRTKYEDLDYLNLFPFNKGNSAKSWVTCQSANLFMADRFNTQLGISQVVSGGDPINTSPLKMTEMYGKLFSGNRNFSINLGDLVAKKNNPKSKKVFFPFEIDNSWERNGNKYNNWYDFLSNDVFRPLNMAITNPSGTAHNLSSFISKYPQYYFYGKTGTGGNQDLYKDQNGIEIRNRHFALVISKENLMNRLDGDKFKNNKFIIIYFSLHNTKNNHYWNYKKEMIDAIMNSSVIKDYFEN